MLIIKNLHVNIDGLEIIKGLNLTVPAGEVHAIMGPNGSGKSTLAKVLSGHPSYEVTCGEIFLNSHNLVELEPEERVHAGLFMGFQYPVEIKGCSNFDFLLAMYRAKQKSKGDKETGEESFKALLREKLQLMQIKEEFLYRDINSGFSGGEKKKNEILQMALLEPLCAILDETDSGLDIDAMKVVAEGINKQRGADKTIILITHYKRLLDYVRPDKIHVMREGKILLSEGFELAAFLEEKGYEGVTGEEALL